MYFFLNCAYNRGRITKKSALHYSVNSIWNWQKYFKIPTFKKKGNPKVFEAGKNTLKALYKITRGILKFWSCKNTLKSLHKINQLIFDRKNCIDFQYKIASWKCTGNSIENFVLIFSEKMMLAKTNWFTMEKFVFVFNIKWQFQKYSKINRKMSLKIPIKKLREILKFLKLANQLIFNRKFLIGFQYKIAISNI